jgi:hypothetical protein
MNKKHRCPQCCCKHGIHFNEECNVCDAENDLLID